MVTYTIMSTLGSFLLVVFILWALGLIHITIATGKILNIIIVVAAVVILIRLIQGKKII